MPDSLLEPELAPHWEAWKQAPSPRTAETVLRALDPVARAALTTYAGGQGSSPTLASKAKLIMLKALPAYDPARAKLKTYMMAHLQGLRRAAAREERVITAPEQVLLDLNHLHEAGNVLRDRLGRDPSDAELADHTGLSPKRLTHIRSAKPAFAEGSFVTQTDGGTEAYAPAIDHGDAGAWHDFVYADLDPVNQLIMEHTLGLHGKPVLSNQALAAKIRLSPGAVSQRKAKIQALLDQRDVLNVL